MSAVFRVSAKQRLELIKQAWAEFRKEMDVATDPVIDKFAQQLEDALTGKLEPKAKPTDPAE
jgi:hypothetical protein